MATLDLTTRQRIMQLIAGTLRTSRQLAELVGVPERQIEDHLAHIVRSVARYRARRFVLDPSAVRDCNFAFRGRTRLPRPSRGPSCRSEPISPSRYGIE